MNVRRRAAHGVFPAVGAALTAAGAFYAGSGAAGSRQPNEAPPALGFRCLFASSNHVSVEILPDARTARFENGPRLTVTEYTETAPGKGHIKASSPIFEMILLLDEAPTLRFRSVPGNFDELPCKRTR